MNRMTNRCKNITLPQTSFAGGNNRVHSFLLPLLIFSKVVLDVVNMFKNAIIVVENGDFNDIPNYIIDIINDKSDCNLLIIPEIMSPSVILFVVNNKTLEKVTLMTFQITLKT